jgi:SAM-dependent methyltransferase
MKIEWKFMKEPKKQASLENAQRDYYAGSAATYDNTHVKMDDEHAIGLAYMIDLMSRHGVKRILDVGCGTGRATKTLLDAGFDVIGIEPVGALLQEAEKKGIPKERLLNGSGLILPFPDESFDAVCEFGVLHHVEHPNKVVREMLRVARTAIFLSDTNRFGRGRLFTRVVKLALWKLGIWRQFYFLAKGFKSYDYSECDGIAFSYSVYDSFNLIEAWADRVIAIPTKVEGRRFHSWVHPLMTSSHVLLSGIKGSAILESKRVS